MRRGDSEVEAVEARLSADRRETRARRTSFHPTIVVGALAALATTGISSSARPRQGTAGQPEATHDLSEAVRLAELERPSEALAYVGRFVRQHPSSVAGRSLVLNVLLGRSWPLPLTTLRHASAVRW